MLRRLPLLVALLCGGACGGAQTPALGPTPPPVTRATLAPSARCHGQACDCRPLGGSSDAETVPPTAGSKRFELRLGGSADPMWLTVDGAGTMYRAGADSETACYYVDLPAGPHEIHYRAAARDPQAGMAGVLRVAEYGPAGPYWYDTLDFACGGADGPCTHDDMVAWHERAEAVPRGINDRCGSTRYRRVRWTGERVPGEPRLSDLQLDLELYVESRAPDRAPCHWK